MRGIHHVQSCQGQKWHYSAVRIKMILSFTDRENYFPVVILQFLIFFSPQDILLPSFYSLF